MQTLHQNSQQNSAASGAGKIERSKMLDWAEIRPWSGSSTRVECISVSNGCEKLEQREGTCVGQKAKGVKGTQQNLSYSMVSSSSE